MKSHTKDTNFWFMTLPSCQNTSLSLAISFLFPLILSLCLILFFFYSFFLLSLSLLDHWLSVRVNLLEFKSRNGLSNCCWNGRITNYEWDGENERERKKETRERERERKFQRVVISTGTCWRVKQGMINYQFDIHLLTSLFLPFLSLFLSLSLFPSLSLPILDSFR